MCIVCARLKAKGLPPLEYHKPKQTLEEKLAKRRAMMERKTVKIPVYYADNNVRRARLKTIRERLGYTQGQFAAAIGLTHNYYQNVEIGKNNAQTTMAHLRLAEAIYKKHYRAELLKKTKEKKRRDANLRASVIEMHVTGMLETDIAEKLAIDLSTINGWLSGVNFE